MKQINSIAEIVTVELDVGDRLGLFNESCSNDNNNLDFEYTDGWSNLKSMWDFRWEPGDKKGPCESLGWLQHKQILKKKVKELRPDYDFSSTKNLNNALDLKDILEENLNQYDTHWLLQRHNTSGGYYSHTTLDIYITRIETSEEFQKRVKAQIDYVNNILEKRYNKECKAKADSEASEKAELERLQQKYGKA